ncbi:hypothetical protein PR202_gb19044 [Eleusine coracana subsp. coracana]|uniref:PROP1-like PPR domain-containing protein n=1 Tax=Eleusine coracana subsp. coracana TaxID=191504 RepID=A0AAV5F7Q5_ELECO|nr:hypothetical protein PR202_gb19044 [Eleusine coracana subsp. coracana]
MLHRIALSGARAHRYTRATAQHGSLEVGAPAKRKLISPGNAPRRKGEKRAYPGKRRRMGERGPGGMNGKVGGPVGGGARRRQGRRRPRDFGLPRANLRPAAPDCSFGGLEEERREEQTAGILPSHAVTRHRKMGCGVGCSRFSTLADLWVPRPDKHSRVVAVTANWAIGCPQSTPPGHSMASLPLCRSPSSILPSWPHRPISASFHPRIPSSTAVAHVSVQDPPPPPPDSSPNGNQFSSNTRHIWVNPNSPRAAGVARSRVGSSHRARLASAASVLGACEPSEAAVAAALQAAFPEPPSEQDAVIVLNTADTSPETAVLALRWFLEHAEVRKKAILYNVVLKLLRKKRRWSETEVLWSEMLRDGVQPDNATFSTIISCARACGLPTKAVEWFEKMPEFGCSPDMLTYSTVIDAYGRAGNAEAALSLYDRARAEKWQLDPVICSTVIKVHSTSGNFDGALNVFEEMKAVGVKPNLVVYNTMLDAMGRAMRPWVVKTIHREMIDKKVQPSRATYCCLLHAYTRARYGEDAMAVYRLMKDEAMVIDVMLYNMLLSMCADIGYVDEAEEILET